MLRLATLQALQVLTVLLLVPLLPGFIDRAKATAVFASRTSCVRRVASEATLFVSEELVLWGRTSFTLCSRPISEHSTEGLRSSYIQISQLTNWIATGVSAS
jgi:hypothetical protein